ncbi:LamG-like jellyroll fold domain-containing protein, partial [Vibrio lentus]
INIPNDNDLNIDKNFTISAWVKPVRYPTSGLYSILSKDNNYEFHLNSSGKIFWWWQDVNQNGNGGIKTRTLTSEVAIPRNDWSFITIKYEFID